MDVKNGAQIATNVTKLLQNDRLLYRSFGPHWWPMKSLLVQAGMGPSLGRLKYTDPAAAGWFDGQDRTAVIREALTYHGEQVASGRRHEAEHSTPDDEAEPYMLHDPDME